MFIVYLALMLIGLVVVFFGIILWKKQKITIIHSYHYTKVKEEDIEPYTKAMGHGVIIIGISIFLMPFIWALNNKPNLLGGIVFGIVFLISMIMIYKAQKKYNGGMF